MKLSIATPQKNNIIQKLKTYNSRVSQVFINPNTVQTGQHVSCVRPAVMGVA
jgi:hypothetical protein